MCCMTTLAGFVLESDHNDLVSLIMRHCVLPL